MEKTYEVYLVSDSTGETLDRIFLALQAQFSQSQQNGLEMQTLLDEREQIRARVTEILDQLESLDL